MEEAGKESWGGLVGVHGERLLVFGNGVLTVLVEPSPAFADPLEERQSGQDCSQEGQLNEEGTLEQDGPKVEDVWSFLGPVSSVTKTSPPSVGMDSLFLVQAYEMILQSSVLQ